MRQHLSLLSVALLAATNLVAQDAPRERGTATASVGNKKVVINYGRPVLKGRSLDDLLKQLPEDRIWRAGENQVTTIVAEGNLTIGDKKIPAGKYSLYVHVPLTGPWALVVNRDLGVPLGTVFDKAPEEHKNDPYPHFRDYQKSVGAQEVARVPLQREKTGAPVEQFTIELKPAGKGATLLLSWGGEAWSTGLSSTK
jgi:Protein of unknown function (DUF2911)